MVNRGWSWGDEEELFPAGLWDDFDGTVQSAEYEIGQYGGQIHIIVSPASYEYEPRGQEYDEDETEGNPQGWYGLGGDEDTYKISEDSLSIESGPRPQKQTTGYKLMMAAREFGQITFKGNSSLSSLVGAPLHWKIDHKEGVIKSTGKKFVSDKLYPVGPAVGKALLVKGSKGRKTREDDNDESEEEERPRRRRQNNEDGESNGPTIALLIKAVRDAGDEGLSRRKVANALLQYEEDEDESLIADARKKSNVDQAIKDGKLEEDDGVLFIPEED